MMKTLRMGIKSTPGLADLFNVVVSNALQPGNQGLRTMTGGVSSNLAAAAVTRSRAEGFLRWL